MKRNISCLISYTSWQALFVEYTVGITITITVAADGTYLGLGPGPSPGPFR